MSSLRARRHKLYKPSRCVHDKSTTASSEEDNKRNMTEDFLCPLLLTT